MSTAEYVDVLIVGAGLSGIGAACFLRQRCPERSFAVLEGRERMGGTWDLFRYPGIRSDSDMFTLGYAFKPWTNPKSIADGADILSYIKETSAEYGIDEHIRYSQRVKSANWDSASSRWVVQVEQGDGELREMHCNFLYSCTGYYSYDNPYTPEFAGTDQYQGQLFHAQHWPEGLDYKGKKVVVVGSGATAVTVVPEVAQEAAHTVMLQRSPTYMANVPAKDEMAIRLRKWLPERWVYHLTRWKKVSFQLFFFNLARKRPQMVKRVLLGGLREELGPDYDIRTHFTPRYNPWDERLCAVPDGDMFEAIRDERVEVVTDHIDHFTDSGVVLKSGRELPADIVVLATGLNLLFMGGIDLSVDGEAVDPSRHYVYRGMMLSDVPNLAQAFGYTNSSWTLKADLTAAYVCRLLNHMREAGKSVVTPVVGPDGVEDVPMLDFTSGYVQRSVQDFPKQGAQRPWRVYQNYFKDLFSLRFSSLKDTALKYR